MLDEQNIIIYNLNSEILDEKNKNIINKNDNELKINKENGKLKNKIVQLELNEQEFKNIINDYKIAIENFENELKLNKTKINQLKS